MLVVTRKRGEKVIIRVPASTQEQVIAVTVVNMEQGRMRIGFEAPRSVDINREEVDQNKQLESGK